MKLTSISVQYKHKPPLDADFIPAKLARRVFEQDVAASGDGVPLILGFERSDGSISRIETATFPDHHPRATENLYHCERLIKFLLWQRGGWKVIIGGLESVGNHIKRVYTPDGERDFDCRFMGERVYERSFSVVICNPSEVPPARERQLSLDGIWAAAELDSTSARRT